MSLQVENYQGNPNVKKDGVVQNWSPKLVKEYAKCMNDPSYFAQNYCKIISLDEGLVSFKLYQYQKEKLLEVL